MWVDVDRWGPFRLDDAFVDTYRERPVRWGFGALSWVTFKRSYSRDGESWWQTCRRVLEGTYTLQRVHCRSQHLPWDEAAAQARAQEAYRRMWAFQWTPPGRGLWIMGTRFLYERGAAALNNCGFVSTRDLAHDFAGPFAWMLQMSMLGVGIGFDTRGSGAVTIAAPRRAEDVHVIEDSREGWAEAVRRLLAAHAGADTLPARWDYGRIRPRGTPLAGFGGLAGGPEPLREMLEALEKLYASRAGSRVDAALIVDTMALIGRCVVAGGIRRSAQIALGEPDDATFCGLKHAAADPHGCRWVANHSVLARTGMDYAQLAADTARNGEPGYLWLDNARRFGRMGDPPDEADAPALGTNPCAEQTLWDRELCCLVETYPAHHASFEDYQVTLRLAFEYAKTVTLVPTHDPRTNAVMQRNRRIGCSMTGVVQAIERHGYRPMLQWCDRGYALVRATDRELSDRLGIPRSLKTTTIKPSGSVSLLAGATPGVHWDHAPHYLRRVRVSSSHPLVALCRDAGYPVEPDAADVAAHVISFPVEVRHVRRRKSDVSLREKIDLAAQLQRFWSDNQVSCTLDFDPEREAEELPRLLASYEDRLKSIVFLPSRGHGYAQAPYETLSRADYASLVAKLRPLATDPGHEPGLEPLFCDGDVCELP